MKVQDFGKTHNLEWGYLVLFTQVAAMLLVVAFGKHAWFWALLALDFVAIAVVCVFMAHQPEVPPATPPEEGLLGKAIRKLSAVQRWIDEINGWQGRQIASVVQETKPETKPKPAAGPVAPTNGDSVMTSARSAFGNFTGGAICIAAKVAAVLVVLQFLSLIWGIESVVAGWTPMVGTYQMRHSLYLLLLLAIWTSLERSSAHSRPEGETWRLIDLIPAWAVFCFFLVTFARALTIGVQPDTLVTLAIFTGVAFFDLRYNGAHRKNGTTATAITDPAAVSTSADETTKSGGTTILNFHAPINVERLIIADRDQTIKLFPTPKKVGEDAA